MKASLRTSWHAVDNSKVLFFKKWPYIFYSFGIQENGRKRKQPKRLFQCFKRLVFASVLVHRFKQVFGHSECAKKQISNKTTHRQ